jgi:outer membrane protein assembly factor BamA
VFKRLLPVACAVSLLGSLSAQTITSGEISQPARKVLIRRIVFQNAQLLSSEDRREISQTLRNEEAEGDSAQRSLSGLADEAAERVRAVYQNRGYFMAQAEANEVPVVAENAARYDVVVRVLEEGKQYRLGDMHFIHVKAFPDSQLRELFPEKRGEIFSKEQIAKGLENLRHLYGSAGYVNFTSVPSTEIDDEHASIDLQVDIDEDRVFHWGNLHVNGMRGQDSEILLRVWEGLQGQIYTSSRQELESFFRRFFRPLRRGTNLADCVVIKLDGVGGTVDVYLNLLWNPNIASRATKPDGIVH